MKKDIVLIGDALDVLRELPDESVNCCVTSPPYFGLRDYGHEGQIGLEPSPELYVQKLVDVFREVKRVLRSDGTLWLNLGDSYCGGGRGCDTPKQRSNAGTRNMPKSTVPIGLKPKDLIGIPWRVALALQADGWYLRSDIIWQKNNPMPESVTDRPTRSHEYIFLLSKSAKYYYDHKAIMEPVTDSSLVRLGQNIEAQEGSDRANGGTKTNGKMKAVRFGGNKGSGDVENRLYSGKEWKPRPPGIVRSRELGYDSKENKLRGHKSSGKYTSEADLAAAMYGGANGTSAWRPMRNKRDVWTVNTHPYKGAHFAVFPEKLITPCILAGCPVGGVVLDPFLGSGTTAATAVKLGRHYVGIELNADYASLIKERTSAAEPPKLISSNQLPLF